MLFSWSSLLQLLLKHQPPDWKSANKNAENGRFRSPESIYRCLATAKLYLFNKESRDSRPPERIGQRAVIAASAATISSRGPLIGERAAATAAPHFATPCIYASRLVAWLQFGPSRRVASLDPELTPTRAYVGGTEARVCLRNLTYIGRGHVYTYQRHVWEQTEYTEH